MDSRLNRIGDWESLAWRAEYCPVNLADLVGVTDRHLRRFFTEHFESTPRRYLDDLRLRQAREVLARGVCVRCAAVTFGFRQASHFSRAFKAAFGVPPSQISRRAPENSTASPGRRKSKKPK